MKKALVDVRSLRRFDFGPHHPFKVHRLGLTMDLMAAYGLIDRADVSLLSPRLAHEREALGFHSQGYLETLRLASSGMWVPNLFSHNLGTGDNPVFTDVYDWAMTVAGASIQCAEEILEGRSERALNISGGLHHAMPSKASGFCHINDAVLAIQTLRSAGMRVAYVDIDAHHGDGVQEAFYRTREVLTLSIHQTGYTIFPGTGFVEETGAEEATGRAINIPLQPGAGDEAYQRAFEAVVIPFLQAFHPDVLVTQLGADALLGDVVANLRMSLAQFERCVVAFRDLGVPWLALGGGGYDVGNVVRAWTLAWGVMLDTELPDDIPSEWLTNAASYDVVVRSLRGTTSEHPTADRVLDDLDQTIERLCDTVYPLLEGG